MKKIIVKAKLSGRDKFEKKLNDIDMDFSPIYWQHDRVYVPREYKKGMNYPRMIMRTEMKAVDKPASYYLILKRHIEDSGIDIVEDTPIKDYEEMVNIILQLGFKLKKEVSRRRQEIQMGDETVMYLDNVEGTSGYFAKIETVLNDGESVAEVRKDLVDTLAVLGEKNLVDSAYFEAE